MATFLLLFCIFGTVCGYALMLGGLQSMRGLPLVGGGFLVHVVCGILIAIVAKSRIPFFCSFCLLLICICVYRRYFSPSFLSLAILGFLPCLFFGLQHYLFSYKRSGDIISLRGLASGGQECIRFFCIIFFALYAMQSATFLIPSCEIVTNTIQKENTTDSFIVDGVPAQQTGGISARVSDTRQGIRSTATEAIAIPQRQISLGICTTIASMLTSLWGNIYIQILSFGLLRYVLSLCVYPLVLCITIMTRIFSSLFLSLGGITKKTKTIEVSVREG